MVTGRRRLVISGLLTAPVVIWAVVPASQLDYWAWVSLALSLTVVFGAGWPVHSGAAQSARRGRVTTDTLASATTVAVLGLSLHALILGDLRDPAARQPWLPLAHPWWTAADAGGTDRAYFEVAAVVTTVVLLGRYLGNRAGVPPGEVGWPTAKSEPPSAASPRVASQDDFAPRHHPCGAFVPSMLLVSTLTAGLWLTFGATHQAAITAAVAVLVVACPGVLALGVATALLAGARRSAQQGIRIRHPAVLTAATRIDTVVMSKTGTVTTGHMQLTALLSARHGGDQDAEPSLLRLAGSLETGSEHPIGRAIVAAAQEAFGSHSGRLPQPQNVRQHHGMGVSGDVEGHRVIVGRQRFMTACGVDLPDAVRDLLTEAQNHGSTTVLVAIDGAFSGVLILSDTVQESSTEALEVLTRLGVEPLLLTGDNEGAARRAAAAVGIGTVVADAPPQEKVALVKTLQAQGRAVAVIGDCVEDAAALVQADLAIGRGVDPGGGTTADPVGAGITVARGDLRSAADAVLLCHRTLRTVRTSIFLTWTYYAAATPLAAFGLLNPSAASAVMVLAGFGVVARSSRLGRCQMAGPRRPTLTE
ncbi:heavy metal translocating P-type ATPase [Nesterenkonia sphaerica]|uniref:Cation-translocating P-type ATPase n=1 Tax=Nesterenkonia sphaerica TaxID=1804988 RepID=A0A5R9AKL1_9MICC|nr:HAD-IC family P-type ATPase [Nesterenkonia sphaerica]TLP78990.1 cation-translocating P-type ATPase [Nesterenkonia sphaerica]